MGEGNYKPYSAKRWTDVPVAEVIGYHESTPEEGVQHDKNLERIMKEYGVLGKDESIENGKVIKK